MATKFLSNFRTKVRSVLPRKKKIEDYYEIRDIIGSGHYSTVRSGIHKKTGEEFALKIIDKSSGEFVNENCQNEIEILRTHGHHPNVVSLKEVFEDRKRIIMVMELVRGGELLDHIRRKSVYTEKEASKVIRSIIRVVHYLHSHGIVHRDLKPENILFTSRESDSEIKLVDFEFARVIGEGQVETPCGSPIYVAPEIVKEQPYGKPVDMWSLGVILYILLCGFPPFFHENVEVVFTMIAEGRVEYPEPFWGKVTPSAKELVAGLLKMDPKDRFTAEEALKHPWVSGLTASAEQLDSATENMRSHDIKPTLTKCNEYHNATDAKGRKQRGKQKPWPKALQRKNSTESCNNNNDNNSKETNTCSSFSSSSSHNSLAEDRDIALAVASEIHLPPDNNQS
mmetsp:Transcript_11494/g.15961  ORF Transcript_11494/g.15961 Transcript_11494/m.15961 type:complete len:396 (-) Transcript_11494:500-1687(-)